MAQYVVFLILVPLALGGSLSALWLPRIEQGYQRFAWLRFYNYMQLIFLANNTIELLVRDPALKQALASIDYLLLGSGPAVWLLFSLEYTSLARVTKPWHLALFAPAVFACAAAFLNGPNGLIWRGLGFERQSWLLIMRAEGYGLGAIALFVYDYFLLVLGAIILVRHTVLSHKLYRRQTSWLIAGILMPLTMHFLYISRLVSGWTKDFSAIAGAMGGFCFTVGCLRYRLFSMVPVSRQTQLERMRVGLVVVDEADRIIDLNQAACSMLGISEIHSLGRPAAAVLAHAEAKGLELLRYPIQAPEGGVAAWQVELRQPGRAAEAPAPSAAEPARAEGPAHEDPILTLGELRVVEMLALNLSNKEISNRLGISVNTVKFHLNNAYRKTGARNRAELLHRIGTALAGARG